MKFFEFLIAKLSGPTPSEQPKAMETSGIVLVAGATGGVGRRVVDILRKKGLPIRVLVFCLPSSHAHDPILNCYDGSNFLLSPHSILDT